MKFLWTMTLSKKKRNAYFVLTARKGQSKTFLNSVQKTAEATAPQSNYIDRSRFPECGLAFTGLV